jgi:signal transduction histidine kinase
MATERPELGYGLTRDAATLFDRLVGRDDDPRGPQLALLVPVALDLVFRWHGTWDNAFSPAAQAGWALIALATVAAVLVSARLLPQQLVWALPVTDIAAIGLLRVTPGSPIVLAMMFPAIWLGLRFRGRGVVIALLGTASTVVAPGLADVGIDASSVARGGLLLLTVGLAAGAVAMASDTWAQQHRVLEDARRDTEAAMAALTAQRRIQEAVVTTVDVGLVALDAEGRYSTMNPRHQEFMALAYPDGHAGRAGQLGAVYAADGVTPLADPQVMPSWRAAHGEEFEDCLIWVGADARTRRALAVSARSVRDDAGRFSGAVLAYHDVTDLLSALRARDEFVATVSHELRTPLTSIVGFLDVVRSDIDGLPTQASTYLDAAARNAERLVRLVSDLLQVGQHDAGVSLDVQRLDLADTLRDCVETARPRAAEAGLVLGCNVDAIAAVSGDVSRLRQLFDNLLANAVKYSGRGGRITVDLAVRDEHACVTVRDTGIGIAADELAHLFTRFFRSQEAHRMAIQGVGLGLAICKDIAEAHGGTIAVTSEPGVGSEFVVRLPLAADLEATG